MLQEIILSQPQMSRQGVRRLLVLSGSRGWQHTLVQSLRQSLPGDWLWSGRTAPTELTGNLFSSSFQYLSPSAARTLLGQEFRHAVVDVTEQLDVEALAIIAGTLAAGSWLVLLAPGWSQWSQTVDHDSLRWNEGCEPIVTPNFVTYLQHHIVSDREVLLYPEKKGNGKQSASFTPLADRPLWSPPEGKPTAEQQRVLQQLESADSGIWILTAARGRGKSAVAGMLVANWSGQGACWLTAPMKESSAVLQRYAKGRAHFLAPDMLSTLCHQQRAEQVDWLLVDEAAAIPLAQLYAWLACFPRVLLISTVQGYEGTGRGFLLKLCAGLPARQMLTLTAPVRWAQGDPLQRFIDNLLLLQEPQPVTVQHKPSSPQEEVWQLSGYTQEKLAASPQAFRAFYLLLTSAHYRTRPLDLRRLLDAPGMSFGCGYTRAGQLTGAVWRVNEGGLDLWLAREIWAGRRRPRGNLVAQSIAAHGGEWRAPVLSSSRISRIAVEPVFQRQGIARALIMQQLEQAQLAADDFLSVSFGFTLPLWHFWQACGFQLLRIGSHKEASSGCFSVMATIPISPAGRLLVQNAQIELQRNAAILAQEVVTVLWAPLPPFSVQLCYSDWQELSGFAFAQRTLESAHAALLRLLLVSDLPFLTLRQHLQQRGSLQACVQAEGVRGKKELLVNWRGRVAQALIRLDSEYSEQWRQWVQGEVAPLPMPAS